MGIQSNPIIINTGKIFSGIRSHSTRGNRKLGKGRSTLINEEFKWQFPVTPCSYRRIRTPVDLTVHVFAHVSIMLCNIQIVALIFVYEINT